jgi:hypothetical protein
MVQYSQPRMNTYGLDSQPVLFRKRLGETEYEWLNGQLVFRPSTDPAPPNVRPSLQLALSLLGPSVKGHSPSTRGSQERNAQDEPNAHPIHARADPEPVRPAPGLRADDTADEEDGLAISKYYIKTRKNARGRTGYRARAYSHSRNLNP